MISKHQRISVIIDELLNFFFSVGSTSLQLNIEELPQHFVIKFNCDFPAHKQTQVSHLISCLQTPPQTEIETCYGDLAGTLHELELIGMMVDEAKATLISNHVDLILVKYK